MDLSSKGELKSMKIYTLEFYGKKFNIGLAKGKYVNNGKLAVLMYETTPKGKIKDIFGDLTVNLGEDSVMANETNSQFIDTNNLGNEITQWLVENNIAKPTFFTGFSGYCAYPLFKFNDEALNQMGSIE